MTNYYVEKEGKIIFFDTDLEKLCTTISGQNLEIQETERPIVNFEFADTAEYLAQKLEEAKVKKLAETDAKQSEYLATPFEITLRGFQFPCVATDKVVNESLPQAIKDAELTGTTVFYDPSNPQYGFDDLTLEEINSVALAISERRKPTYIKKRALKFAIKSAVLSENYTKEDVESKLKQLSNIAIDYTGG